MSLENDLWARFSGRKEQEAPAATNCHDSLLYSSNSNDTAQSKNLFYDLVKLSRSHKSWTVSSFGGRRWWRRQRQLKYLNCCAAMDGSWCDSSPVAIDHHHGSAAPPMFKCKLDGIWEFCFTALDWVSTVLGSRKEHFVGKKIQFFFKSMFVCQF